MKILLTTDNIGGVWTYSITLARGLKNTGIDVCLAVIGEKLTDSQIDELSFTSWYSFLSKQEWMDEPWEDISRAGQWLQNLAMELQPDIVHLNSYSLGSLRWNVPVVIVAHSCVLSWWESVRKEPVPSGWARYRESVILGLQGADAIVAPGKVMMESIEKFYLPNGKKFVISNGAESSGFTAGKKENYIFSMGRLWDEAKNVKLILEAAPLISYPICIAGEFSKGHPVKLPGNIHFFGRLSPADIRRWLSDAAVYLLPVRYEPFGYTFLEAALAGCALITGDIPSMRELWGEAAVYVDPDDYIGLAETVNDLMGDKNRRELLSAKARERAMEYTSEKMTGEYIKLYDNILQSSIKRNLKLQEQ